MDFKRRETVPESEMKPLGRFNEPKEEVRRVNGNEYDKSFEGKYFAKVAVNFRKSPTYSDDNIISVLKKGDAVHCLGEYKMVDGTKWLYVLHNSVYGYVVANLFTK